MFLTNRRIISFDQETVKGTAENLLNEDVLGMIVNNVKFEPDIEIHERDAILTAGYLDAVVGKKKAKISFQTELKGKGVAYTPTFKPDLGRLFQACGFKEEFDGTSKYIYKPDSKSFKTVTIGFYEPSPDGSSCRLWTIKGAVGTFKISSKNGDITFVDFEFTGIIDDIKDETFPDVSISDVTPPAFLNASFSINGTARCVQSIEVSINNDISLKENANKSEGFDYAYIFNRKPSGSFLIPFEEFDPYYSLKSGQSISISYSIGSTTGNKISINIGKAKITKVEDTEADAITMANTSFIATQDQGDDEIVITFE